MNSLSLTNLINYTMTPSELKVHMIEMLEDLNYTDQQLIESFVRFLPQSQLEELQDSIQMEEF